MNLQKKYFHGILPYEHTSNIEIGRVDQLTEILHKFESILKSGYILSYKDIENSNSKINRHPLARINGNDRISF